MDKYILTLGENAKKASKELLTLDTRIKNNALREIAKALIERKDEIKEANKIVGRKFKIQFWRKQK